MENIIIGLSVSYLTITKSKVCTSSGFKGLDLGFLKGTSFNLLCVLLLLSLEKTGIKKWLWVAIIEPLFLSTTKKRVTIR